MYACPMNQVSSLEGLHVDEVPVVSGCSLLHQEHPLRSEGTHCYT